VDGLNTQFMQDPVQFLSGDIWDINASGSNHAGGSKFNLDQYGVGSFDLYKTDPHTVVLRESTEYGFWKQSFSDFFKEKFIKAYYLRSVADRTMSLNLNDKADYFFTDVIDGCSLFMQGNTRHQILVQHMNSFTRGAVPLRVAEIAVRRSVYPVKFVYGSSDYRADGFHPGEDANLTIVTVFGWRRADGWHFYARRRINNYRPRRPRALDGAAFELA
jgi:hypothetical protein